MGLLDDQKNLARDARAGRTVEATSGIPSALSFAAGDVITVTKMDNASFNKEDGGILLNAMLLKSSNQASAPDFKFDLLLFEEDVDAELGLVQDDPYDKDSPMTELPFAIIEFDSSDNKFHHPTSKVGGSIVSIDMVKAKGFTPVTFTTITGKNVWAVLVTKDAFVTTGAEGINIQLSFTY